MSQNQRKGTRVQTKQDEHGLQAQFEQIEEYSPYPPAEFLQQLSQIDKDLVKQVMDMAEKEQQHRHNTADTRLAEIQRVNMANIEYDKKALHLMSRGQWFGLTLGLGLVILAGLSIYFGAPWVAGTAITAIVGILIVYVLLQQPNQS